MLPLTRPSTPTPCLWHPKGHKQSPGFFHFLLRVCAYSTPDLGALSPIPRQDLSAGSDNLFSLHYLTLGAPAFSWSISISISVKVLEFPYSSLHSGRCMSSNQGLFLWPSLVCLPQPHMGSDILHIVAFVRNINFWYLRQGDRISPFMFYCFRKGKKGFFYLFIFVLTELAISTPSLLWPLVSQFEEWFLSALPAHFPFEGFTHKSTKHMSCVSCQNAWSFLLNLWMYLTICQD